MTTDKGFKRLVRARMARTGERYAAARRAILGDDASLGMPASRSKRWDAAGGRQRGIQPISASLTKLLAHRGVRSGIDGEPLTEATILGIGGGLGAG